MTMTGIEKEFGFYPQPVEVDVGDVTIRALVDFDEIVEGVQSSDLVHDGWIYAGLKQSPDLPSRQIRERPFSARVFGLGKTHRFEHGSATGEEHVAFHLWTLSFFLGMRPIEVVHHAKPAGTATRLDAYANTRVKRHRPSWQLRCDTPPDEPSPSPLAMRNLKEKK